MDWIKQHPYLTAGLAVGLIVLYAVFRNIGSGSGTTVVSAPAPTTGSGDQLSAIQAQTSAGVATAQIQANVQSQTIDAQKAVALGTLESQVIASGQQFQSQTDIATVQAGRDISVAQSGVDVAGIQANRDVAIAGTAASVAQIQAQTALEAVQANDAASVIINGVQTNALVDVNAQNNQTQQLAITTTGDVYKQSITTQGQIAGQQLANQQTQVNQFFRAVDENDRFGSAGAQVATLSAILGAPGAATVSANQAQAVQNAQPSDAAQVIGSIGKTIASVPAAIVKGIFG